MTVDHPYNRTGFTLAAYEASKVSIRIPFTDPKFLAMNGQDHFRTFKRYSGDSLSGGWTRVTILPGRDVLQAVFVMLC